MVGGDPTLLESVRPALEAMGRSITHAGKLGTGLAAKLVNNMIAIHAIPIVAGALRLGLEQGLELATMIKIIQESTGNTWLTDQWDQTKMLLPFLLRDPGQLDSLLGTGMKDLELAAALCEECGLDGSAARHAIQGLAQQDAEAIRLTIGKIVEALERG
jgi:3-hydroxyisobutyrate dehydrogenase-like beta-hydroxyacid dehydrogenase